MKQLFKMWRSFWGNRYRVYKDEEVVAEVLIYRRRIYILSDTLSNSDEEMV